MDEKKRLKADCEQRLEGKTTLLPVMPFNASNQEVVEKTNEALDNIVEKQVKPKISHPNQTNPIYKNLAKFNNTKIGEKLSVKDLLR